MVQRLPVAKSTLLARHAPTSGRSAAACVFITVCRRDTLGMRVERLYDWRFVGNGYFPNSLNLHELLGSGTQLAAPDWADVRISHTTARDRR